MIMNLYRNDIHLPIHCDDNSHYILIYNYNLSNKKGRKKLFQYHLHYYTMIIDNELTIEHSIKKMKL